MAHLLKQHLKDEHKINVGSRYLSEIVYGGNDGIVTTFAVVAGFAGAGGNESVGAVGTLTVILFGIANLLSDGSAMGLGNFLSVRSERDLYDAHARRERYEIQHHPDAEIQETLEILAQQGYSTNDTREMTTILSRNSDAWLRFMMEHELEMTSPSQEHPALMGLATFASFVFFGSIPLIPYVLFSSGDIFVISCVFTLLALVALGLLRWYITRDSLFRSIGETILVGGICASIAYGVGLVFRNIV